ncbi:MAG: PIN domain-containing protein [Nitrospirota bacterium]|mgnify:CR=1 FL=1|jgi:predicted nucleic acid-binding protein|nr:PIN domain-containing protein [Nitrospirota bacterium]
MRRLIIDTNLYIDWLNAGKHEPILFQPNAVKFMSAVVMMELLAGAHAVHDRTCLHDLFRTFTKLGRIVTPSSATYQEAGNVLRQLQTVHGYHLQKSRSLANDVLIALSARTIGGTVVTQNKQDFLAIQSICTFKLSLIS